MFFLSYLCHPVRPVLVVREQQQCQLPPLPSRSLTQQRVFGLGGVGLQADSGNGGLEAELDNKKRKRVTIR